MANAAWNVIQHELYNMSNLRLKAPNSPRARCGGSKAFMDAETKQRWAFWHVQRCVEGWSRSSLGFPSQAYRKRRAVRQPSKLWKKTKGLCWLSRNRTKKQSYIRRLKDRESEHILLMKPTLMTLEFGRQDLTNSTRRSSSTHPGDENS
jgi:hypothetical protein